MREKMFDYSQIVRVRRDLVYAYQEQGDELPVTFRCSDGEQKCGEWMLRHSKWFSDKLDAYERYDNEMTFDYTMYSKESIKSFLDVMHGLKMENISLVTLLELLSFLLYEGKCGEYCQYLCDKILNCILQSANPSLKMKCFKTFIKSCSTPIWIWKQRFWWYSFVPDSMVIQASMLM